jgi:PTS system nitrogen regulatory IIA component
MIPLEEQNIILELESTGKESILRELAENAHHQAPAISTETIFQVLKEREHLGSTGVGNGVAIPHGKLPGLDKLLLCFARSRAGIGFEAKDNRPVHLFVAILSPLNDSDQYLQTLARVSKLLKDDTIRNKFIQATSSKTIFQLFNRI